MSKLVRVSDKMFDELKERSEVNAPLSMGDFIYQAIMHMTQEQRDYFKRTFSKEQWSMLCKGQDF
jgi:hypothetical protein